MEKKIILVFVILLFTVGIVFGENNTTDKVEIEDKTNYIHPISITSNGIKFDDGFTGFCIDLAKSNIETSDKFTLSTLSDDKMENQIKLAIIECYKQGKEDAMGAILSQINDQDSNNKVLKEVFNSNEKIDDHKVVKINDTTEATFDFEFLKSSDDAKSDCLAYKVSTKTIEKEDKLSAKNDDVAKNTPANKKENLTKTNNEKNNTNDKKTLTQNDKKSAENSTPTNNTTNNKKTQSTTNETNKTTINKTNTVIVNENNTTIINHNNKKVINDTNKTPKNDTDDLLKKAGNPILILIIVIVIIVIAVAVMRRRD